MYQNLADYLDALHYHYVENNMIYILQSKKSKCCEGSCKDCPFRKKKKKKKK
jgi:hypothetical protein